MTTMYHDDATLPRSNTTAKPQPQPQPQPQPTTREAGSSRPLQPLNQNVEHPSSSSMYGVTDIMAKKRGPRQDCYGYKPSPIIRRDDNPAHGPTGDEDLASPPAYEYDQQEPHQVQYHQHHDRRHYMAPSTTQYFPRQPYFSLEEGRPTYEYSGYLEDDFDGIPPPPPQRHVAHQYEYEYGPPLPPPQNAPHSYNNISPYAASPPPGPYSDEPQQYSPPPYDSTVPPSVYSPTSRHRISTSSSSHQALPFDVKPPKAQWQATTTATTTPPRSPGELQELDIVCGRGAPTNYHYGNQVFKELVQDYQTAYLCAKRSDKPQLAMKILDLVNNGGARFVKREKTAGVFAWVEIDSKGAYEKVCQALREGAPDLRNKVLQSTASMAAVKAKKEKGGSGGNSNSIGNDKKKVQHGE